jgi:hypothetical protein
MGKKTGMQIAASRWWFTSEIPWNSLSAASVDDYIVMLICKHRQSGAVRAALSNNECSLISGK